ncbi:MAG: radical SAM protein [Deferribacterota bacterium]|nr:radical SAM protein [Deferribacterota bacterium]
MENKWELKWMAWEITLKCNLSCVHCRSAYYMGNEHSKFDLEKAHNFLDEVASFAKPAIVLTGGEPLLREDIYDIIAYGTDKGFRMCVATNGTLVNDDVCKRLKDSGTKIVSISLDGSNKKIHDNFRGQNGAFDKALEAVELFNKHGIPFIVNSSFTKRNQDDIENVYKLAKSLGATAWYMFLIVPTGKGKDLLDELVSKEDYERILNWHYDLERNEKDILIRPTCAPQYYRVWYDRSKREGLSTERRSLKFSTGGNKGCVAAQLICFVNSSGDVYPCSYFPLSAGNVFRESFKEIWYNSSLFNELRDFKKYEGKCGVCRYLSVCGGCRARAYAIYDNYMAEEPYCDYIPLKYSK